MKRNKQENQVYCCSWQKVGRDYILTCSSPVTVTVHSADLDDAMDKLVSEIMTLTGDGEACLQFVPNLPFSGAKQDYFEPEYHAIGYSSTVEWTVASGSANQLTAGGVCKKCKLGLGIRTEVPRLITTAPRYDVSGFYKDRTLGKMFSEDVLKHILPHINGKAKLVPVAMCPTISKKVRKKYFELSFEPDTSVIIPREYKSLSGWRCKACGTFMVFWLNPSIASSNTDGIERSQAISPVIFFKKGPGMNIAVNKSVHDALCSDKSIRGFVSSPIAMFDEKHILSQVEINKLKLRQIEP